MPGGRPGGWHRVTEGESGRDGISDDEEGVKGPCVPGRPGKDG